VLHLESGVETDFLGEHDEGPDRGPCCRAGGQPGVDIALCALVDGSVVGVPELAEEPGGLGDLLFRRVDWCLEARGRSPHGADATEMVPGCELFDWLRDLGWQRFQLGGDPLLESGKVRVAWWQEIGLHEERPKVVDFAPTIVVIEAVVGQGSGAGRQGSEECSNGERFQTKMLSGRCALQSAATSVVIASGSAAPSSRMSARSSCRAQRAHMPRRWNRPS